MASPYGLRTNFRPDCQRTRQRAVVYSGLQRMFGRLVMYAALLIALGIVVVSACTPQQEAAPSPTPAPSASRPPAATPTVAATATVTARPRALTAPLSTATPGPGNTPAAACPRATGGSPSNQVQLVAVRVAHPPRFDRLGFDLSPTTAPGPVGNAAYAVEVAHSASRAS